MYVGSKSTEIAVGNQYQIRINALGDRSLLISDVSKNMTGLYECIDRDTGHVYNRVLLNVISKYTSLYTVICYGGNYQMNDQYVWY